MQQFIDSYDFTGKKAIVRVDFNVPLNENFEITDDTRIRAAIPTLKKVLEKGGALIIMSHLGRPKGVDAKFSLKHIVDHVSEKLGVPVQFAPDCQKADAQAAALKPGEALLLENLRFYAEEEGKPRGLAEDASEEEKKAAKAVVKESQKAFTAKLASYADCYINDAFGTAHRAHASTALIAKYFPNDKMFGYLMEGEIKAIDNVLKNAKRPLTAIIGGSKVSSKLAVLKNLVGKVDNLIIGGGMGYTFIKATGGQIGLSLHEDDLIPDALSILEAAKEKGVNVSIACDAVCTQEFSNEATTKVFPSREIPADWELQRTKVQYFADTILEPQEGKDRWCSIVVSGAAIQPEDIEALIADYRETGVEFKTYDETIAGQPATIVERGGGELGISQRDIYTVTPDGTRYVMHFGCPDGGVAYDFSEIQEVMDHFLSHMQYK